MVLINMGSVNAKARTHELLAGTLEIAVEGDSIVTFLAGLSSVKPAAYTQSLSPVLALTYDDFFDRVEALSWLNFEENKLVPTRRNALARNTLRLWDTVRARLDGIQLECAAPF